MTLVLLAVGLALIVFGAIVLVRFSDRPGGTVKWLGVEISSAGAGLPLVGLGIGCVLVAALQGPAADRPESAGSLPGAQAFDADTPRASPPAHPSDAGTVAGECLTEFLASLPADRVVTIETGMRDLEVIGPHQPLEEPFGLLLTEFGQPIGALRVRLYRAPASTSDLYRIEAIVDAGCEPVEQLRNASRGGSPYELVNWYTVHMHLGENDYELRIGGEGDIGVSHFNRVR
jgi:hypothetical protein